MFRWIVQCLRLAGATNSSAKPTVIDLNKEITLGGIFDFTTVEIFSLAEQIPAAEALQGAVAMQCAVNAQPGYKADIRDSGIRLAEDGRIIRQFVQEGVAGVIGPTEGTLPDYADSFTTASATPQFDISPESITLIRRAVSNSFFQLLPSVENQMAAMLKLVMYFKWTLIGGVFDATSNGLAAEAQYQVQTANLGISTTCNTIIVDPRDLQEKTNLIVECLSTTRVLNVVILWVGPSLAQYIIQTISASGSVNKKVIFLGSDRWSYVFDPDAFAAGEQSSIKNTKPFPQSFLQGSFAFYPFYDPPEELKACLAAFKPADNIPGISQDLIIQTWEELFSCKIDSDLPACAKSIYERISACACTGNEKIEGELLSSSSSYSWQATRLIIIALQLVKSPDCAQKLPANMREYCGKNSITTEQLSSIIGIIGLPGSAVTIGPFSFFQGVTTNPAILIKQFRSDASLQFVGGYKVNESALYLNSNEIQFKGGKTPGSRIVPVGPGVNNGYAYVAVVVLILGMFFSLFSLFYFLWHRNNYVVIHSGVLLVCLACIGATLFAAGSTLKLIVQLVPTCMLATWFLTVGGALCLR